MPKNKKSRKVGSRKKGKSSSWEAKELSDIQKYWKPGWSSKEGKRRTVQKST